MKLPVSCALSAAKTRAPQIRPVRVLSNQTRRPRSGPVLHRASLFRVHLSAKESKTSTGAAGGICSAIGTAGVTASDNGTDNGRKLRGLCAGQFRVINAFTGRFRVLWNSWNSVRRIESKAEK